jgi:hypothetical protein
MASRSKFVKQGRAKPAKKDRHETDTFIESSQRSKANLFLRELKYIKQHLQLSVRLRTLAGWPRMYSRKHEDALA